MERFFTTREQDGHTVIEFETDALMNPLELEQVGQALYKVVDAGASHRYRLEFGKVQYLSSQAIGVILTLNKKLSAFKDHALVLTGVGPQVLQMLKITRLDKLLTIQPAGEEKPKVR